MTSRIQKKDNPVWASWRTRYRQMKKMVFVKTEQGCKPNPWNEEEEEEEDDEKEEEDWQ